MAQLFRVFIPLSLRHLYDGKARIAKRWKNPKYGLAWQAKEQAKIRLLEAGAERAAVGLAAPGKTILLEKAGKAWLSSLRRRPVTIRGYRQSLSQLSRPAGRAPLAEFDLRSWEAYCRQRRRAGASDDALARERFCLQALAKWAANHGHHVHPALLALPKLHPRPVVVRRFDPASVRAAIDQLEGMDRVVAEIAAATGMRSAEIRAAQVEWVRLDQGVLEIPHCRDYSPKGGRPRVIPLGRSLVRLLRAWIGERSTGPLIPPRYRRRGSGLVAMRHIVARLKAAGVVRNGLHDLRHHCLSKLAADGAKAREIQEVAGHASSRTTDIYTHASPDYLESVRRVIDRESDSGSDRGSGVAKWVPRLVRLVV